MNHKYDLFEKFPDGSSLWRACVVGLEGVRIHMSDLARRSPNTFYAMSVASGKIVRPDLLRAFGTTAKVSRRNRGVAA